MHRIHSSAKIEALERSLSQTVVQQNVQSPLPKGASTQQNAARKASSRFAASYPPLGKQQNDGNFDDSYNDKDIVHATPATPSLSAKPLENTNEKQGDDPPINASKPPTVPSRMKAGSWRFLHHTKDALFHSWINVLLVFVPIGIALNFAPLPHEVKPTVVFAMNAVAIIPLAGLLSHATESVASRMGDTMASLLNVTFGNAVELIIFIIALAKNEIRIVQAAILGSILANLLLILGMAFLLGGLRFQEQLYNSTVTQMSACLLSLSVTSLLLPTAFHASFRNVSTADDRTIKISRGTSVVLLLVYILYLLFQLKSHAYMYESTPQQIIDEESHPGVLADVMNSSSSSEDTSSSSSTDSEASSGSINTTKRRIKKAWRHRRRRKSVTSSVQTPSAVSSPSNGLESSGPPSEGYFDPVEKPQQLEAQLPSVLSGDEADTDGERMAGTTRVRDFQTEKGGESIKSIKKRIKKSAKKSRPKKSKAKTEEPTGPLENMPPAQTEGIMSPRVDFVEEPQEQPTTPSGRRPFAIRQFSTLKPPLPNVLANTVFTNSPTARSQSQRNAGLRRASSLPDRLPEAMRQRQRQPQQAYVTSDSAHGPNDDLAPTSSNTEVGVEAPPMSRTAAVMLLLCSTGLVAFCAELLVEAIPEMIQHTSVSQTFIGLIVLPIVGNAAEHVTAVTVATKNKMDLAIGVSVGSSIQIALFITPVVVILGWIMDKDMSLYFNLFETVSLFVTAFVVNFLVLDGRSNYLEGSLLIAAYVIIALAAFFYPNEAQQSALGGGSGY